MAPLKRDALAWTVVLGGLAFLAAAGCSHMRVSGQPPGVAAKRPSPASPDQYALDASTRPARRHPEDYLPAVTEEQLDRALYYSDLGPDTIDVSSYTAQEQYNYKVYSRTCSQCHTLARSINSPMASRSFWEFYVLGMRFRSRFMKGVRIPKGDVKAVLDFLEYDAKERKLARADEFEELTAELKRRFEPALERQIQKVLELQKGQPLPRELDKR